MIGSYEIKRISSDCYEYKVDDVRIGTEKTIQAACKRLMEIQERESEVRGND